MKTVIIRPERCVGCLQCRLACAVENSASKNLYAAIIEATRPQARLRIYPGGRHLAFPNKCRHCDPAPCQEVCIAGAIRRDAARSPPFARRSAAIVRSQNAAPGTSAASSRIAAARCGSFR